MSKVLTVQMTLAGYQKKGAGVQGSQGPVPVPVTLYAGSPTQPEQSSYYSLPGIGTIQPGGPAIAIGSAIYSLAPAATALYSNGVAVAITALGSPSAPSPKPQVFSFEGSKYTADSASKLVIDGQTLQLGSPATRVNDYLPDGIAVAPSVLKFGGSSYTANLASEFVVAGQALAPGPALILSSTQISSLVGGGMAVVGSSTQVPVPAVITSAPVLTISGSISTAYTSSDFVIEGKTLTPGGTITVSGTAIALPSGGKIVVIGTSTQALAYATITSPPQRDILVDGATYTADASSDFLVAGQTLTPGGVITVSGVPVSYAAAGTDVVVGTSTQAVGLGGLIMSGFGTGAQGTSAIAFTGNAPGRHAGKRLMALPLLVSLMLLIAFY